MKWIIVNVVMLALLIAAIVVGAGKEEKRGHWCFDKDYQYVWCN